MCCTSNRSLFLTDDRMSFSQVDDLYADLTHVSKMLVDHPCTDDPDLFYFPATLQCRQSFQVNSFSQVDYLYAVLAIGRCFSQVGDLYADLIHVSKVLVDHPCSDYPDLCCFLFTLQNMQSFQVNSFSQVDELSPS